MAWIDFVIQKAWGARLPRSSPLQYGSPWQTSLELVGDGNSIKIRNDNWGFEGLNGDYLCPTLLSNNERLMRDLWNHNYTGWNKERVNELFGCTNRDRICNLPIIANGPKDSRRVGHEILPTYANISSIHQNFNKVWPWCGEKEETLIHALKDYPKPRAILSVCGLDNRLLEGDYSCYIDWIKDIMRALDMKADVDFFATLWTSWNNRNNFIFRGQDEDARTVWERAKTRDLNCGCGRVFGRIAFIGVADITDAITVSA
ncbi:hypothetical protein Golax_009431, partial [Gossypium laxum]|nr:hypothetical protein [Gossypium laxum]